MMSPNLRGRYLRYRELDSFCSGFMSITVTVLRRLLSTGTVGGVATEDPVFGSVVLRGHPESAQLRQAKEALRDTGLPFRYESDRSASGVVLEWGTQIHVGHESVMDAISSMPRGI